MWKLRLLPVLSFGQQPLALQLAGGVVAHVCAHQIALGELGVPLTKQPFDLLSV